MTGRVLTIGELATATGVPASAVRFYERRGLLRPDTRSRSNYRLYGPAALERLKFIRAAARAGFTLKDIAGLTAIHDAGKEDCGAVRALIEARLKKVDEQVVHLQHVQTVLEGWRAECKRAERVGRCGVLRGLHAAANTKSK